VGARPGPPARAAHAERPDGGRAEAARPFGDDLSDIRAFQALRARAAQDPSFFGVCVAVANPETGQELSAAADLTLDSPAALADFLHTGVETLRR
jgi:trehalose 6-phosphate phosphatase